MNCAANPRAMAVNPSEQIRRDAVMAWLGIVAMFAVIAVSRGWVG